MKTEKSSIPNAENQPPNEEGSIRSDLASKRRGLYLFVFLFFWWFFGFYAADYLRLIAENDGFYFTGEFFSTHGKTVAGPLNLLTVLFQQSFARPVWGGLLLSLLFCSGIAFGERFFHPRIFSFLYGTTVAVLISLTITLHQYAFFGLHSPRLYLMIPLGVNIAFFAAFVCSSLKGRVRFAASFLAVPLLYPLIGVYAALTFVALLGERRFRLQPLLLTLLALLTPILWYPVFSSVISVSDLYATPLLPFFAKDTPPRLIVFIPILMTISFLLILLPFFVKIFRRERSLAAPRKKWKKREKREKSAKQTKPGSLTGGEILAVSTLCLLLCLAFFGPQWDRNFRLTLAMRTALEEEDWEKILSLEAESDEPTMPMILLRRLAQFETGAAAETFFDRTQFAYGTQELAAISSFRILGPEILFRMGNPNIANRSLMNIAQSVYAPDSPRTLKTLARSALANGEYRLAERYFALFDRSINQRLWSKKWRAVAETLELGTNPPSEEIAHDAERIREMRSLRVTQDYVGEYLTVQYTILYASLYYDVAKLPKKYQEMQLIRLLLLGKREEFERDFAIYHQTSLRGGELPIPTVFQDAILFNEYGKDPKNIDYPYPIAQERIKQFQEFSKLVKTGMKNPRRRGEIDYVLEEVFGGTVWYYFFYNGRRVCDY